MADKQPDNTPATDQPTSKKRLVKNPETFRERAVKASQGSDKPKRGAKVFSASRRAVSPVGRGFRKIFYRQPFRFIGKILVPSYFRSSASELKLVSWPNWGESRRLTYAVLAFAVVFGTSIALVDYGLDKVFKTILLK